MLAGLCAWNRAVGELAGTRELSNELKMTLNNLIALLGHSHRQMDSKLRYAIALTLEEVKNLIAQVEVILTEYELSHPACRLWPWSPHLDLRLYRHPLDGGEDLLATRRFEFLDLALQGVQMLSFVIKSGTRAQDFETYHRAVRNVWPYRHEPPLPVLHLPLSPLKAGSQIWSFFQRALPALRGSHDPLARERLVYTEYLDYLLRLFESESPSDFRLLAEQGKRPDGLPALPQEPPIRNYAPRRYLSPQPAATNSDDEKPHYTPSLSPPTKPDDLPIGCNSVSGVPTTSTTVSSGNNRHASGASSMPRAEDEAEVPESIVAFSGEAFGGDVLIFPNTRLSQSLLNKLLERIGRRREAVVGMSPSETLRYMRTQDGKEWEEVVAWEQELAEWKEMNGIVEEDEFDEVEELTWGLVTV